MRGHEGFSSKVHDPVTELIMARCEKVSLFSFKGMSDLEGDVAFATQFG